MVLFAAAAAAVLNFISKISNKRKRPGQALVTRARCYPFGEVYNGLAVQGFSNSKNVLGPLLTVVCALLLSQPGSTIKLLGEQELKMLHTFQHANILGSNYHHGPVLPS